MATDTRQTGRALPRRTVDTYSWRLLAGASGLVLSGTAMVGGLVWSSAGEHLTSAAVAGNVAGGSLLVVLIGLPAVVFILWPVDIVTRRLPRAVAMAVFAVAGATVFAAAGFVLAALAGDQATGALLGAAVGALAGTVGFLCAEYLTRPRWITVTMAVFTAALVIYGTVRAQVY